MIYKEKSKLCLSFFGITISSGLMPLFRYRDNGIINNMPQPDPAEALRQQAKDSAASDERSSVLEALKARQEEAARETAKRHRPHLLREEEVLTRT